MEISIVVPALNSEKTIEKCIISLLNQDFDSIKYEIIAVDNDSSDNTYNILKKYKKKITILKERKKGPGKARNKGILKSKGSIVVFIDSDCVAEKEWLKNLYLRFKDKNIIIVGGEVKALDKKGIIQKYCDKHFHSQKEYIKSNSPFCATANCAIRKNEIIKNNMFDDTLYPCEDLDLCNKILKGNNKSIIYEKNAIVKHDYPNSLIFFIKNAYSAGKCIKKMREKWKKNFFVKKKSYWSIIKDEGVVDITLKIIYDFVFRLSYYLH